jgi:uncharacterized protein (DUF302 family)
MGAHEQLPEINDMRVLLLIASMVLFVPLASAADDLAVRASKYPVKETLDRLVAALDDKGIKVAARIDHAAGAKAAGLDMKPTEVLMFGNPKLGTPLMLANPHAAIDLPMRVLAWEDKDGKVWVGYIKPDALKARHALAGVDEQLKMMAGALEVLTKSAAE